MTPEEDEIYQWFCSALAVEQGAPLGLAVSGGGDSMAMLHLGARYADETGVSLRVVTVDHGLRAEAAKEAEFVARTCAALGIAHDTVVWEHGPVTGNLQNQARRARYQLMADWANDHGIKTVALAHTMDDQAETVLLRLAREAGVDGLSGMQACREQFGITWLRPLLQVSRAQLREFLTENEHDWVEDPSNEDRRFDRIKARDALHQLEPLGISARSLAAVATNMASARQALESQSLSVARRVCQVDRGDVVFDQKALAQEPPEIVRRLLQHALMWVSSADYPPRSAKLGDLVNAVLSGKQATLYGCIALPQPDGVRICREYNAVKDTVAAPSQLWDGRWKLVGSEDDVEIRALGGEGLLQCPNWRESGMPRASLLAKPAVWREDTLVAAPHAGIANGWRVLLAQGDDSPFSLLISH